MILLWWSVFYSQEKMDQSGHRCRVFLHASMICCEGVSSTPKRDHQSTCREFLLQFNDLFSMCLFYSQETMNHQCVAIQTWIINVSHNMITMSTAIISNKMLLCASLCCCWLLFVRCFGALHSIDKPKTTMMTTILHTSYAWIWNNNELIFLQQEIDFWIQQETKTTLPTPPTRRYI